jgi:adenylosuccinate lyase
VENISVGQISGAVGNFAHLSPRVEEYVCRELGLKPAPISTQVLQRDRHAEYLSTLALIASSLDKIATEIRNLQRTEILEVEEPFGKGQKGSSAMPHKRNPITCERVSGLARILRGNAMAALENVPLWHERDITHSSVERVIVPDSCILLDYMLAKLTGVLDGLIVYPENMMRNLKLTRGLAHSQALLLRLVETGISREDAYRRVQEVALSVWNTEREFLAAALESESLRELLDEGDLRACFDLERQLRHVSLIFERVLN